MIYNKDNSRGGFMEKKSKWKLVRDDSMQSFMFRYYEYVDENGETLSLTRPDGTKYAHYKKNANGDVVRDAELSSMVMAYDLFTSTSMFFEAEEFKDGVAVVSIGSIDDRGGIDVFRRHRAWLIIDEEGKILYHTTNSDMKKPERIEDLFIVSEYNRETQTTDMAIFNPKTGVSTVLDLDQVRGISDMAETTIEEKERAR